MTRDLSLDHAYVGDLFQWPASREEWDSLRLSDKQVARFHRDGFLADVPLLDERQCAVLRDELSELAQPGHDGEDLWYEYHSNESGNPDSVLFHALGAWRLRPGLHDILWSPRFLMAASQLLGGAIRFWHDQLFCKPAGHGGVVAWHQDYSYWTRTHPIQHLTCWIGLDDSTRENGCVLYVPESHRWNLLPITGLAGDMVAIKNVLSDKQWIALQNPVAAEMPAGHGVFHHSLTVHGSEANRSPRPRRAIVLNVFRDGTLSGADEPLLQGVPAIAKDTPMGGPFFPFLFDPDNPSRKK